MVAARCGREAIGNQRGEAGGAAANVRVGSLKTLQHGRSDVFENCSIWIHLSHQSQSLETRREKPCERGHVGAGWQLPPPLGLGQRLTERRLRTFETLAHSRQRSTITAAKFA